MPARLNRRAIIAAAAIGAAGPLFPVAAFAHRKKRAVTSVEWNARANLLEITHTLHLHDAEQALARLGKLSTPDLTPLRARAQLALYTSKNFTLSTLKGTPIMLSIIGAEIESGQAYVYLEAYLKNPPKGLLIKDSLLHDIYPDQTNLVNVILKKNIRSVVFAAGDHAKKVLA